jgi:hypothetical protein
MRFAKFFVVVNLASMLIGVSSARASFITNRLITFNATGSATAYTTSTMPGFTSSTVTVASSPVDDGLDGETIGSVHVPDDTGITTLDYNIPLFTGMHVEYGWIGFYNSSGTVLEDLIHFDNSDAGGQSMFLYSGATLAALENLAHFGTSGQFTFSSITTYPYYLKVDQNANGSFPLYTPGLDEGGIDLNSSTGGPSQPYYSYQFVVPEPTTLISGALLLTPFGASAFRVLRKKSGANNCKT